jgi:uncharacterized membrane protein YhaH (DUF805 family)
MTPKRAILTCFAKYAQFSGRASLAEYWWVALFVALGMLLTGVLDHALFGVGDRMTNAMHPGFLRPAFMLATFLPMLAAGWRRLHDSGRPGWYLLVPMFALLTLYAVMFFGMMGFLNMQNSYSMMRGNGGLMIIGLSLLALIATLSATGVSFYWLTRPRQPIPNRYGPNPHGGTS